MRCCRLGMALTVLPADRHLTVLLDEKKNGLTCLKVSKGCTTHAVNNDGKLVTMGRYHMHRDVTLFVGQSVSG